MGCGGSRNGSLKWSPLERSFHDLYVMEEHQLLLASRA